MNDDLPLATALLIGALLVGAGAAVSQTTRRAADGRLARNTVAGLRLRSTMRDDAAWRTGHAAARGLTDAAGVAFALSGVAAVAARDSRSFTVLVLGGTAVATALVVAGAVRASRAAG